MTEQKQPKGFNRAEKKAKQLLSNQNKLKKLLLDAKEKANSKKKQLSSVWNDFQTLLRLVKAWWKKDYKETPWKTILFATTAILYFVNPLDLIPDFIPVSGLIDDITVITFVLTSISDDLERFKAWEKKQAEDHNE